MPILVGDGSYPIGPPDGPFDDGPVHIPPGRYVSSGPLQSDAFFRLYGPDLASQYHYPNLLDPTIVYRDTYEEGRADAGLVGPVHISIPLMGYWFDTYGMDLWERIDGPHPVLQKQRDGSWRDLSEPIVPGIVQPAGAPHAGMYNYFPFRMRVNEFGIDPGLDDETFNWLQQRPDGQIPMFVKMPDDSWTEVLRFDEAASGVWNFGTWSGFSRGIPAIIRPDINNTAFSSWGWYIKADSSLVLPDFSDTGPSFLEGPGTAAGISESAYSNVRRVPPPGDTTQVEYSIYRTWRSIDLDLCRWWRDKMDPLHQLTTYIMISGESHSMIGGTSGAGSLRVSWATATATPLNVVTTTDAGWRVPGAALVPMVQHTARPATGAVACTFTSETPSSVPVGIDLSGTDRLATFELSAQLYDLVGDASDSWGTVSFALFLDREP